VDSGFHGIPGHSEIPAFGNYQPASGRPGHENFREVRRSRHGGSSSFADRSSETGSHRRSREASRAAQEANVRFAKISRERAQKLFDADVISKQDYDNAQTNYDSAVAQLKSLEQQVQQQKVELHYYSVSAPMDGIVGDIPVRVGDRVTVSKLLTTVDEPGALEAYIYVPAARARELRPGLPAKLLDENGAMLAEKQITFVSPQVDPETQTVLAKASLGNVKANLRIAQQVRTQITWALVRGRSCRSLRCSGSMDSSSRLLQCRRTKERRRDKGF
jgi:multidrug efflux pump subunit AcrA (membrane-fusion protein)